MVGILNRPCEGESQLTEPNSSFYESSNDSAQSLFLEGGQKLKIHHNNDGHASRQDNGAFVSYVSHLEKTAVGVDFHSLTSLNSGL